MKSFTLRFYKPNAFVSRSVRFISTRTRLSLDLRELLSSPELVDVGDLDLLDIDSFLFAECDLDLERLPIDVFFVLDFDVEFGDERETEGSGVASSSYCTRTQKKRLISSSSSARVTRTYGTKFASIRNKGAQTLILSFGSSTCLPITYSIFRHFLS